MAKLTEIEATYRVVTPLFCAGADPQRAEIRVPSFKGVLRFWWRALVWSRYGGGLQEIKRQEDELFGSADGGQSRVLMRLILDGDPVVDEVGNVLRVGKNVVGDGFRYLGYGVMEAFSSMRKGTKKGQLTRPCLRAPFNFTIQMRGRDLRNQQLDLLKDALIALGTLGGMGAKSRKGYGSLAIWSIRVNREEQRCLPQSMNGLCEAIKAFRSNDNIGGLPEFTVLSAKARHILLSSLKKEPLELLNLIGRELVRYRSWGHSGRYRDGAPKVLGKIPSEKNFWDDHDLMKGSLQNRHPRRIAFGLPHNYGKKQVIPIYGDRRASPLFIHIHECGNTPVAVLSFLPAWFLPKGKSDISVGRSTVPQAPENKLYQPVHDFLDRLLERRHEEPFTDVREVKL